MPGSGNSKLNEKVVAPAFKEFTVGVENRHIRRSLCDDTRGIRMGFSLWCHHFLSIINIVLRL